MLLPRPAAPPKLVRKTNNDRKCLMAEPDARIALLAGASGLTGGHALEALLGAPEIGRVLAVSRRPLGREHPRLANRIVQFERLETQLKGVSCDFALCCLGTTRRQAGSPEAFRAIDLDGVLAFARAAKAAGGRRFVVISSVGASATARNLYLRTKGEMEEQLTSVGFESLDILQPSLLLGWRREIRPLEIAALAVVPLLRPLLRGKYLRYRAISARALGAAMLGATRSGRRGVQRYDWEGLQALARVGATRPGPSPQPKAPARAR
jgi:uncharacterized protein YbjT (DUF2867 family)